MILGYTANMQYGEALEIFWQMQLTCVRQNYKISTSLLPACGNLEALVQGREVHGEIIRSGFQYDVFAMNAIVYNYEKFGIMEDAHQVFEKMHQHNVVSWMTIVAGYAQNEDVEEAHKLFQKMPDKYVLSWTTLIAGYAKYGHGEKSLKIFQDM